MFCKTCGGLLILKKTPYGKWMACPQGHAQPELNQEQVTSVEKNLKQGRKMEVSDGINILAVHDHTCKKCGHDKAELLEIMPSYSDEDCIFRMKCGNCGVVEQLEGKVK
ncbi:hypothetical protein COV20_02620 [Candidatus Woesearchaeota archaeon CG10_big_fil_rev_8_21_14_0_10_45_16]|nr:MAG: hypothetical protein COV20_02620 [Candidatus Woesearchaeota archaeon CG10_big_fil_rev_8_21_14_0_10_45_16]